MARPCASCESRNNREIDRRLRAGSPQADIALWLASVGDPIDRTSIGRHARRHLSGMAPRSPGRRPVSADFLQAVVDIAHEGLASGELSPSVRDAIGAQAEINRRLEKMQDRDLLLKVALVLTGNVPGIEAHVLDPEQAEIEAEYRQLSAGSE